MIIVIIEAHIRPNSKVQKVELDGRILKIHVKSPPEGNKANREMLETLNDIFGSVQIIKGLKAKNKLIKLPFNDISEVKTRLDA